MAESSLSANSDSPCELKRSNKAEDRTGAGTPVSIAAFNVQRPSPEPVTEPSGQSVEGFGTARGGSYPIPALEQLLGELTAETRRRSSDEPRAGHDYSLLLTCRADGCTAGPNDGVGQICGVRVSMRF